MDEQALKDFLHQASLHTYADPNARKVATPLRPGCDEYVYEEGDWKYYDSYAWTKDGGGEEIIYYKGTPVWVMNYYGYLVGSDDAKDVMVLLHKALALRHPVLPVRGDTLVDDEHALRYEISFERAELGNFVGREQILRNNSVVYACYFHGGFVR